MAQLEMEYALSPHAEQSLVKMGLDGDIRSAAWRKQGLDGAPDSPQHPGGKAGGGRIPRADSHLKIDGAAVGTEKPAGAEEHRQGRLSG